MTEPAVGASTCASGSQVWKGNIGTLMAKPMKKAQKIQSCRSSGICGAIAWNWRIEKVSSLPSPSQPSRPGPL